MRNVKNNILLDLYQKKIKSKQKHKEQISEYDTVLESYNKQINDNEEKKKLKYRIAKGILLLALLVYIFRLIYFWERIPKVEELTLYNSLLFFSLFLVFIAFIFFINVFIGVKDKSYDDEDD